MGKLDELVVKINKEWKEDIMARGIKRINAVKIPFTSPRLNYMLYGGLPRNKIIEFAGEENSGKTTTALDVCKNAQIVFQKEFEDELSICDDKRKKYLESRGVKKIVYADCENTLDEDWAVTLGVDVDNMYVLKPQSQSAEEIFQMLLDMIATDEVGLVIIDSLGVMLSQQAYDKDMTEKTYGGIAMALTLFSKKAELLLVKYDCTLIGINQMRDDMNSMYGGKTTTGGKGWRHNCFSANTEFITDKGIRKFKDFKENEEVTVVDMYGNLRKALVHCYGKQQLYQVVLKNTWGKHTINCTKDHTWILSDGSKTTNLKVGDKLYYREENINHSIDTYRKAEMFCLGFVLADGCDYKSYRRDGSYRRGVKIVLLNNKSSYDDIFIRAGYRKSKETDNSFGYYKFDISKQDFLNGECWKYLNAEDKRFLFEGYYAGDGANSKSKNCVTYDSRVLQMVKECSGMAGYYISSIKDYVSNDKSFKPGSIYWSIQFTTHTNKYNHWSVESIKKTEVHNVYCVEEPITHTFTLDKGIVTGNCCIRMMFAKGDFLDENGNKLNRSADEPKGNRVVVSIPKNKVDKPDRRTGFYTLMYDYGIDEVTDLVEIAIKDGYIIKGGAWFTVIDIDTGEVLEDEDGNPIKIQGQTNLVAYLRENEIILEELRSKITC